MSQVSNLACTALEASLRKLARAGCCNTWGIARKALRDADGEDEISLTSALLCQGESWKITGVSNLQCNSCLAASSEL